MRGSTPALIAALPARRLKRLATLEGEGALAHCRAAVSSTATGFENIGFALRSWFASRSVAVGTMFGWPPQYRLCEKVTAPFSTRYGFPYVQALTTLLMA